MSNKRRTKSVLNRTAGEFADMQEGLDMHLTEEELEANGAYAPDGVDDLEVEIIDDGQDDDSEEFGDYEMTDDGQDDDGEEFGDYDYDEMIDGGTDDEQDEYVDVEDLESATEELFVTEETSPDSLTTRRSRRSRSRASRYGYDSQSEKGPMMLTGIVLMFVGFLLCAATALAPALVPESLGYFTDNLQAMGLPPGLIVVLGIVIALIDRTHRQQRASRSRLDALEQNLAQSGDYSEECLAYLVDAQEQHLSRRPASGEELEQVLLSLARQDEKLTNLTKALKLYGKPLVDLSRQVSELGMQTKGIKNKIEELGQFVHEDVAKQLAGIEIPDNGTDEVLRAVEGIGSKLTGDITQILENMPRGEGSEQVVAALDRKMNSLRESVAEIRRAVSTAPPPAPAPQAQPRRQPQPEPQPKPQPKPSAPGSSLRGDGPGDLAQSISGSKKSSGKGVMGAIAKLKRMRP